VWNLLETNPRQQLLLLNAVERRAVRVKHRATVRVVRYDAAWASPGDIPPYPGGTAAVLEDAERVLLVYDDYPDDYPEPVVDPATDKAMALALTPDRAEFAGVMEDASGRYLLIALFNSRPRGPLPSACEIDVHVPGGATPVGTATIAIDGAEPPVPGRVVVAAESVLHLRLRLPNEPPPDEARTVLDLESGKQEQLRVVFRPSRQAALEWQVGDRYWGGTLDVTVPVKPGPGAEGK
jgi:hypothetical protein